MILRNIVVCGLLGLLTSAPPAWGDPAEGAAKRFDEGNVLLAKADVEGALRAFAAAAKADPENQEYREQHALLRRVIKIRQMLDQQADAKKWLATAKSLRAYYYEHDIFAEALKLDRQVHARLKNSESAAMLAETQLELGENAEAFDLLENLDAQAKTPRTQLLLGIALARQGRIAKAKDIAKQTPVATDAGPGTLFDLACLHSLLEDQARASDLLTKCFEQTPPSRLEAFKTYAKKCPDLRALTTTGGFAKVLQTQSKVKESTCSGGTSCGRCPHRSTCGKTPAHTAKDQKDAKDSCPHAKGAGGP